MIIEERILVRWNGMNRKHFELLGYIFTGKDTIFYPLSTELPNRSHTVVKMSCINCGKIRQRKFGSYSKYCNECKVIEISKKSKENYHKTVGRPDVRARQSEMMKEYHKNNPKSGKDHQCWNPELTDEERKLNSTRKRRSHEYYQWQKFIVKRDNLICQCCKFKFKNAIGTRCHHLDNYKHNIELRHDINNGILLCDDCHKNFHSVYGFKVDKEHFFEYMSANCMKNFSSLEQILEFNKNV